MSQELEMLKMLLEGQKDISKEIKRVHNRLDEISEKAIINEQSIIHLKESFEGEKEETGKKFDIVHNSIRRRDRTLKWIATAILLPIGISVLNFFNVSPK